MERSNQASKLGSVQARKTFLPASQQASEPASKRASKQAGRQWGAEYLHLHPELWGREWIKGCKISCLPNQLENKPNFHNPTCLITNGMPDSCVEFDTWHDHPKIQANGIWSLATISQFWNAKFSWQHGLQMDSPFDVEATNMICINMYKCTYVVRMYIHTNRNFIYHCCEWHLSLGTRTGQLIHIHIYKKKEERAIYINIYISYI